MRTMGWGGGNGLTACFTRSRTARCSPYLKSGATGRPLRLLLSRIACAWRAGNPYGSFCATPCGAPRRSHSNGEASLFRSLDVALQRLRAHFRAVNHPVHIGGYSFGNAGGRKRASGNERVRNKGRYHTVLRAADPNASLPAGVIPVALLVRRLRIGDVQ